MPTKIRTAAALTQLTPAEKRVAELLVTGVSNVQGARDLGMSTNTFTRHLGNIGQRFHVTGRPARAHAVLASGQVALPPTPADVPAFTPDEWLLLQALARYSDTHDIACAARITPAAVRPRITDLVAKAGAENDTHLIGLGHAWGLLGAGTIGSGTVSGAPNEPVGAAR